MSVYVDELRNAPPKRNWPYSRSCHLFDDTLAELHEMAGRLGLSRSWFQAKHDFPHYDLTAYARQQAVARGAIAVTRPAAAAWIRGECVPPFHATSERWADTGDEQV